MWLRANVPDWYTLELAENEAQILNVSLAQVSYGMASPAREDFRERIGSERDEARAFSDKIRLSLINESTINTDRILPKTSENSTPFSEGSEKGNGSENLSRCELKLSRNEILAIVRMMNELANGTAIMDWEFPILIGHGREDVRKLMHQFHQILVSAPDQIKLLLSQEKAAE